MTHDIHTIDTGLMRPAFDAAYLIVEHGRGAFLDCGTSHAVPAMLAAVTDAGLTPGDIDWLILSHVHLDHAGGAGALLQHLPNARVVVHPRGATHMIDPSRLIAGASQLLLDVLNKPVEATFVVIEEVELDNWGWGGLPVSDYRRRRAAS